MTEHEDMDDALSSSKSDNFPVAIDDGVTVDSAFISKFWALWS